MSKKLFSVFPLLAIVAFVVLMPTAAQAAENPHWYVGLGGSAAIPPKTDRLGSAKKENTITWGGTSDLSQESAAGFIHCKTVGAGVVENPAPGGAAGPAGVGKNNVTEYYECAGTCEAAIAAAKAPGSGSPLEGLPGTGEASAAAEYGTRATPAGGGKPNGGNPLLGWNETLYNEPANTSTLIEEKIGEPAGTSGEILATVFCKVGAPLFITASAVEFEGELHPSIGFGQTAGALTNDNGSTVGNPSFAHFNKNPASPEFSGELPGIGLPAGGGGKNEGNVKYEGYATNALIRVSEG
jgi:hypothetical protein